MNEEETKRLLGRKPFIEEEFKGNKVLLHVCCAPYATIPINRLLEVAEKLTCYFYDPNIYPPEEYMKRLNEMRRLAEKWCINTIEGKYFNAPTQSVRTDFLVSEDELLNEGEYDAMPLKPVGELENALRSMMEGGSYNEVAEKLMGFASEPEGGLRCSLCIDLRLTRTAGLTKILGYDAFATTLTLSPKKNADQVNLTGECSGRKFGVKYIWTNFKRAEGFKESVRISKELNLYRQKFCGCKYSERA